MCEKSLWIIMQRNIGCHVRKDAGVQTTNNIVEMQATHVDVATSTLFEWQQCVSQKTIGHIVVKLLYTSWMGPAFVRSCKYWQDHHTNYSRLPEAHKMLLHILFGPICVLSRKNRGVSWRWIFFEQNIFLPIITSWNKMLLLATGFIVHPRLSLTHNLVVECRVQDPIFYTKPKGNLDMITRL